LSRMSGLGGWLVNERSVRAMRPMRAPSSTVKEKRAERRVSADGLDDVLSVEEWWHRETTPDYGKRLPIVADGLKARSGVIRFSYAD
jgi:hypothetical protein